MEDRQLEWIAPCHFGLEAVCRREIEALGLKVSRVEDGKVSFEGDAFAGCRANINLRTAERVLLKAAEFEARTFDELFEKTKACPWEDFIPRDGRFWVTKATSVNSKLFSPSDIQSIMKKAMVERLKQVYGIEWFDESGASYPIRVNILKDRVTVGIDTSGESLHKRGYRTWVSAAPVTETLAAALIMLTPWKGDRIFVDPFCGSGTFCIEAALMAANIAPGVERNFTGETWKGLMPARLWSRARDEALSLERQPEDTDIQGYDIDPEIVKAARSNARNAGVDHLIHFQQRPVSLLSHPGKYGFLFMNPPYGERMEDRESLPELYRTIGERLRFLETWSANILTGYEDAEKYIGRKADKNRKIYNGMLKTRFYQFQGPRPPRRKTYGDHTATRGAQHPGSEAPNSYKA